MSERTDKFHSTVEQEMLKAQRAHAKAAAGPMGLLNDHPIILLIVAVLLFILLIIVAPPPDGPAERAAYDKAKLECRLTGGTYEYFGTQGYACIPAPSSSSNRQ